MSQGYVSTKVSAEGEASVWLRRQEVDQQKHGIATLTIECEGTIATANLKREEVENLVAEAQAILPGSGAPVSRLANDSIHEAALAYVRACDCQAKTGKGALECQVAYEALRKLAVGGT